ncbi:MAG: lipopolysaccharide heptosyltransferase II [Syntrophobacter sp.]
MAEEAPGIGLLLMQFGTTTRPLDTGNIGKILVRSTNWIGDAVMTTPALGALKAAFPHAEIVLAANPIVSELLALHPCCDRVIVYDKKGPHRGVRGLLRFSRSLAEERFDLAILLQHAIEAAIMAVLARIGRRAGFGTDGRRLLLTHCVPMNGAIRRLHHARRDLYLLERLGIPTVDNGLSLVCSDREKAWARQVLGADGWVAINPGAAFGSAKRWYPERFAAVADALAAKYGFRVLLVGGAGEMRIGAQIEETMHSSPLNLTGKTSVRQLMSLLEAMDLVVTNDSGPMHIAAAFDRPIVALFGPTDHHTTSPVCSRHGIVRKETECAPCLKRICPSDHRCMSNIAVEDVLEEAARLLGG